MAGIRWLLTIVPTGMPRTSEIAMDGRALALGLVVSLGSALAFGLVPALRAVRDAPPRVGGTRSDGIGGGRHRLRNALVGAEVALALVLLATTALVIRSVGVIRAVDTGFDTADVVTFTLNLPGSTYPDAAARRVAARELEEGLAALPGVTSAGLGVGVPTRGGRSERVRPAEAAESEARPVLTRAASPGYLATLGVRPVRGRPLDARDDEAGIARVFEQLLQEHAAGTLAPSPSHDVVADEYQIRKTARAFAAVVDGCVR